MVERYTYSGVTWVDVFEPTVDEARALMQEFSIRPSIAEEMLAPSIRAKTERFDDLLYLVLYFPALRHTNSQQSDQEVDFILGRDFLITVRYDTVDALHKFSKLFEVRAILGREDEEPHAGHIFSALIMKLYRSIGHELDHLHDRLEEAEEEIFAGHEREMVIELSKISRDLLNIKQALTPHKEILESLRPAAHELFGDAFHDELTLLSNEYYRVTTLRNTNADSLRELRITNDSLLSTKQNEITKNLTILAFLTFPLSVAAGIFGMNAVNMPIVGGEHDFLILITLMLIATALTFLYFKYKRWI
ncbi:hypothetical protein GVX82_02705 [Patescibacteria group bacterium]|jgi:magnesium transporter|nr:hypothetical protein [Patescibacteria group bacterium]